MAESDKSSGLWWPGLVAAAAVAGGVIFLHQPLRSSRPEGNPGREAKVYGQETIPARLWQDPLEAIAADTNAPLTVTNLAEQITAELLQPLGDSGTITNITVLEIMIPGRSSVEDSESRRRSRYAAVAALNEAGYAPADPDHIGAFEVPWPDRAQLECGMYRSLIGSNALALDSNEALSIMDKARRDYRAHKWELPVLAQFTNAPRLRIPFEWFEKNQVQPPRPLKIVVPGEPTTNSPGLDTNCPPAAAVLVWWLPDDAFDHHPLIRLAQLRKSLGRCFEREGTVTNLAQPANLAQLTNQVQLTNEVQIVSAIKDGLARRVRFTNEVHFKLINPSLPNILEDQHATTNQPNTGGGSTSWLAGTEIYSAWSTTPDALLARGNPGHHRETVRHDLEDWGICFHNGICTDDDLATNLVAELRLRGVDLRDEQNVAAVISDWDTEYGRALPATFAAAILTAGPTVPNFVTAVAGLENGTLNWPTNLETFSYMRGIDGLLPGQTAAKTDDKDDKSGADQIDQMEKPEGQSQLDYIPRLAEELRKRAKEGEREGRELKAIGVLGSDVYDKLLVLQALHNEFPNVIFFTTDLDARLIHPAELAWSRNLIVASSFDLELGENLQQNIPPFRDSYQTGEFLACLAALGHVPAEVLDRVAAKIFEVGRRGAYRLDVVNGKSLDGWLYRTRPTFKPGWILLIAVLGLVLVTIFNPAVGRALSPVRWVAPSTGQGATEAERPSQRPRQLTSQRWLWFAIAVILLGAGVAAWKLAPDAVRQNGEPFSLLDGVSIWPCEIILVGDCLLTLGLLGYAYHKLDESNEELSKSFFKGTLDSSFVRLERMWKFLPAQWIVFDLGSPHPADALQLWNQALKLGRRMRRFWRVAPAVVVFLAFSLVLFVQLGAPFRPVRGIISTRADMWICVLSAVALVTLNFFVADTALLCRRFIERLTEKPAVWPTTTIDDFKEARGMKGEDLGGWISLQLIARRTDTVGKFIYYPFVVLLVMVVARNNFFTHFDWPPALLAFFGLSTGLAAYSAWGLRQATEEARKREVGRLEERLVKAKATGDENNASAIEFTIQQMKDLDEGAFAPWSQQPVLHAVLGTFGGTSLLSLAQYLINK